MSKHQTNKQSENVEESFYNDDTQRAFGAKGLCSAVAVFWIALIALIIGAILIWFLVKPISITNQTNANSFEGIHLSIPQIGKNKPTSAEYTAVVTDAEINQQLRTSQIPHITDVSAHIHTEFIQLNGTVIDPVKVQFEAAIVPKITNDQIEIQVNDFSAGGVRLLPLAGTVFRQTLADALSHSINNKFYGTITKIDLKEGSLVAHVTPSK